MPWLLGRTHYIEKKSQIKISNCCFLFFITIIIIDESAGVAKARQSPRRQPVNTSPMIQVDSVVYRSPRRRASDTGD